MRRSERECTQVSEIRAILDQCQVLRLAMTDGAAPYIVPLNFGYRELGGAFTFYFHCAREGRKLDILRKNPAVCLEVDCGHELVTGQTACQHSYLYQSVIAAGTACELTDPAEKADALAQIMAHLTGKTFTIDHRQAESVCVWRIKVDELSAKAHTK